jgi:hypothetical protein
MREGVLGKQKILTTDEPGLNRRERRRIIRRPGRQEKRETRIYTNDTNFLKERR